MKNQRKDGRFQKWVAIGKGEDGKPIRRIVYGDTAEELAEKAEALKRDAALGKVGAKAPTFSSMAESWLTALSKEKSRSTATGYRSYLNRFLLPALGQKPMAEITAEDVNRVLEQARAEEYSPNSVIQIKSIALRIADFARNNGVTLGQPWDEISPGNTKKHTEQRTLTEDEIRRMLEKDKGHAMCLPALIMLLCGLRGTKIRATFATQNLRLTYGKMLFAQGLHVMEVKYLLGLSTLEAAMKLAERFWEVDGDRMKKACMGYTLRMICPRRNNTGCLFSQSFFNRRTASNSALLVETMLSLYSNCEELVLWIQKILFLNSEQKTVYHRMSLRKRFL